MKNFFIAFFCCTVCVCITVNAQNSYILKNDTIQVGVNIQLESGKNKYRTVIVRKNKQAFRYTPYDIQEFSDGGTVFVSLKSPLTEEQVFMQEIISNDSIAVYYHTDQTGNHLYFKQADGNLLLIDRENNPYAQYLYNIEGQCSSDLIQEYTIRPTRSSIKKGVSGNFRCMR